MLFTKRYSPLRQFDCSALSHRWDYWLLFASLVSARRFTCTREKGKGSSQGKRTDTRFNITGTACWALELWSIATKQPLPVCAASLVLCFGTSITFLIAAESSPSCSRWNCEGASAQTTNRSRKAARQDICLQSRDGRQYCTAVHC